MINRFLADILHIEPEAALGKTDYDFYPREIADDFRANDQKVRANMQAQTFEEIAEIEGKAHTYISAKFPLFDTTGKVTAVCGISTDITAQKEMERALCEHRDELAHVTRLSTLGEMASGIAHEINQPLSAIVSYSQAANRMLRSGKWDPATVTGAIESAAQQAERAGKVIKRLREFVSKRSLQLAPVSVNDLVNNALLLDRHEIQERQVAVVTRLQGDLPLVKADPIQIEQVLLNLIRNSIDAMSETPPASRAIIIATTLEMGNNMVWISVADSGPGIPDPVMDKLFHPFYTTKQDGMGMGLAISESIIKAHGGRLCAENRPEGGAVFRVGLPGSV